MNILSEEQKKISERAVSAKKDIAMRNQFLAEEQAHIFRLTARILGRTLNKSEDEWSIGLLAADEAIDRYDPSKGDFYGFAATVISSRLKDHYRTQKRRNPELLVSNDTFDGEIDEDEPLMGVKIEVRDATAAVVDTGLRDEIEQLMADLSEYDIDLFELPKYSPKAGKTKEKCAGVLEAFFRPPPLTEELKASKSFPFASLSKRTKVSRKLIDKHRKYLIASVLIKAGDYPGLKEFLPATKG